MTPSENRLRADVRALGAAAPIRAAYEMSKRSGLHAALFSGRPAAPSHVSAVSIGTGVPGPGGAQERALADARTTLSDGLRAFGRRVPTGLREPWSLDPESGRRWPDDVPWWRIDIRNDPRDVKFVWEVARHRDLVVLARGARLEPSGPWLEALDDLLAGWCRQNPPERGVNWYSSLELALRAIAWTQVLALVGDRLAGSTRGAMLQQLRASARHIVIELPYTVSSMKNNHLLGDALGLIVLARLFPQEAGAKRWNRLGERLFTAQLARHLRPDGSMIEDSLSYHRFVLEMLIVRVLLGDAPAPVVNALRHAAVHLVRLGVFEGALPQYGDWDEGRVLTSSDDPLDVGGSVALALSLSGEPLPDAWFDRYDELAWYAAADACRGELSTCSVGLATSSGGIAYVNRAPWRVWLKVGAGPSHGHADLTALWVQYQGEWLIADPGTGTYNGPLHVRNGFRTSQAHPVLRMDDEDQFVPHRAFRWLNPSSGHLAPPFRLGERLVLFGWHGAYQHAVAGLRVARAVVLAPASLTVLDFVSPEGAGHRWSMTVPSAPNVEYREGRFHMATGLSLPVYGLDGAELIVGRSEPFAGWHSGTYGSWEKTQWLAVSRDGLVSSWGVGATPRVKVSATDAVVGEIRLAIDWSASTPTLTLSGSGGASTVMRG